MNKIDLDTVAITPFQRRVYEALLRIPHGRVTTYRWLAAHLNCGSAQAVGQALRRNPLAPAVPCHRVIATDLTIGGFAGQRGGPEITRKQRLLAAEGVRFNRQGTLADPTQLFKFSRTIVMSILVSLMLYGGTTAADLNVAVTVDGTRIGVTCGERKLLTPMDGKHAVPLFSDPEKADRGAADLTPECAVDYRIETVANGFDLRFTLSNPTATPARRPDVLISGISLKSAVETVRDPKTGQVTAYIDRGFHWLDSRTLGTVAGQFNHWSTWRMNYPNDMYAPVLAAWDDEVAVGVALLYDPWQAQHDVAGQYVMKGSTLCLGFRLHAPDTQRATPGKVLLPPGETAAYRVAVRFAMPKPARVPYPGWLDSLEPYKTFFTAKYGGVKYARDLRPVMGQPVAQGEYQNAAQNPRGYATAFTEFGGKRVDLDGWSPFTAWLRSKVQEGYRRVMIWAPSGLYQQGANYPSEFMTAIPPKLVETLPELLKLKADGVTLGMWWGNAAVVSAGWNSGQQHFRDISQAGDRQAAFNELDLAVKRGISEVGLDAWSYMALWERYGWLQTLQKKYPSLKFITESSECDIMHTLAPTFDNFRRQSQKPVLADWLVPGHESWIQLYFQDVNQANFNQVVSWHCVPVTLSCGIKHDPKFRGWSH